MLHKEWAFLGCTPVASWFETGPKSRCEPCEAGNVLVGLGYTAAVRFSRGATSPLRYLVACLSVVASVQETSDHSRKSSCTAATCASDNLRALSSCCLISSGECSESTLWSAESVIPENLETNVQNSQLLSNQNQTANLLWGYTIFSIIINTSNT